MSDVETQGIDGHFAGGETPPPRPSSARLFFVGTSLVLGLCVLFAFSLGFVLREGPAESATQTATSNIPRGAIVLPDFSLTERSGKTVTKTDLLGKVWVAGFIFTRCHETCPMVTGVMAQLRAELPGDVRFVSFSVDPRYDRPDVLVQYAQTHHADAENWWFLTGEQPAMYELIQQGFKLSVSENPDTKVLPGERIEHTTRLAVVDRGGNVRGYFDSADQSRVRALVSKVNALREETD
ncbi:MAG: SCO family protein [Planctomycetota bacterium]